MLYRAQVAPHPLPLSVQIEQHATPDPRYTTSFRYLSAVFGGLSVDPETGRIDRTAYECGVAIGKASVAIEDCYHNRKKISIPQTLLAAVRRTIRHARRVVSAEASKHKHIAIRASFDKNMRLLRRKVIRAIRHEQLEFRYISGGTFRPTSKSLRGKHWELASFVNAACYAVTKALGCFHAPLLSPNAKPRVSDETALTFWDTTGLEIIWDPELGWTVEPMIMDPSAYGSSGERSTQGASGIEDAVDEDGSERGSENCGRGTAESGPEEEMEQASLYEEAP